MVETCFVPLLAWVVDQWEGTQMALALDATTLGDRFTVLGLQALLKVNLRLATMDYLSNGYNGP